MDIAVLDNLAVNHSCWLQRCSAPAKALFAIGILVLLLTTRSLPFLGALALFLFALAAANCLPWRVLGSLALLPMLFAAVFAVSLGDWRTGLLVVGRAGLAGWTAAVVFATTPPVRLLGLLAAPMPPVFGELLYFTYRALFLLGSTLADALTAVRLRRGREGFSLARLKAMARVYGMLLLRAWDLAGRQYELLRLRGLGEGLRVSLDRTWRRPDWALLVMLILLTAGWYYV
ncbi:MAG: hypothetical protein GX090_05320 [Firmicutes bacterium]|mgnify:CR=1 FL=1|nr:hypothetical protein [Bacillota bacterium]HOB34665.1 energy-coupling factor transporter transmembrane component T [Bacillota bacterium]HPZ89912.1 energy-coupling factor transporter transmembrane component T [Bacillota bacterium]HQE01318.1 energy-coupling factor transporter transmembrane component T [Bacillota bacterium]